VVRMSSHRKAFLVWLTTMTLFVGGVMALDGVSEPELDPGAIDHLIEAATANANALREDGNLAEAERWDCLVSAAKAELAAR
jgi:hypothetical protein